MRSTVGLDIAAPPELVFRLCRDVERWERLLPHYVRSRSVRRTPDGVLTVDFVARRPLVDLIGLGLPVAWRARTWSEPGMRRLRFVHVAGATRGMDVTWRIEPAALGTRVTIEHDFRPRLAILAAVVDGAFARPIARRTLAAFKALAETTAAEGVAIESDRGAATNRLS